MVYVHALERTEGLFDHAPILLTTGTPKPLGKYRFKFELGWLQHEGFHDIVKSVWKRHVIVGSPIQRWNNKLRSLCSHLSGWARHVTSNLKQKS
jgi:hypothetical protein